MTVWSVEALTEMMEELIPFNRFLGMKVTEASKEVLRLRIPFRPELIGDPVRPALHGGVISTLIDTAGGAIAFLHVAAGQRVSTVDLVVDYLRPGPSADIEAEARVVRAGNRVVIASVVVHGLDAERTLVAQGRGVYNIAGSPVQ